MAETIVLEEKQQKKLLEASAPASMSSGPKQWLWGDDPLVTLTCTAAGLRGAWELWGGPDPQDRAGLPRAPPWEHSERSWPQLCGKWGGWPCSGHKSRSTSLGAPGDLGSIPRPGRSPGEGNGSLLQYSGLENSMDCTVHEVTKSRTRLSDFHDTAVQGWRHG